MFVLNKSEEQAEKSRPAEVDTMRLQTMWLQAFVRRPVAENTARLCLRGSAGDWCWTARIKLSTLLLIMLVAASTHAEDQRPAARTASVMRGIEFAQAGNTTLLLDLYRPPSSNAAAPWPTIVWVHGGAWRRGTRDNVPIESLTSHGFAIASVDYRLSPVARFPAQVHDIKAAIRFLRANADHYGLDKQRFVIAGASAGGHLAALVGVSGGQLEGSVGKHSAESSAVSAIVSFYGASNLQTILSQSTPHGLSVRVPALKLLLGDVPTQKPDIARLANPVAHVDKRDPPLLLIHGDQDPQMPINQSHELHGRYEQLGLPVQFKVLHGAAHGGAAFYTDDMKKLVSRFISGHLSKSK